MNRLYVTDMNSQGVRDLIITDSDGQIIDSISEAVFGNIPSKHFGWSGDAQGNIDAVFFCESVSMVSYDQPHMENDPEDDRTLVEVIKSGEISDFYQVVQVSLDDVLKRIAVSPVSDGSEVIAVLSKHFNLNQEQGA